MRTDITTFCFPESNHEVRSLIIDDEPYFILADVHAVLDLVGSVSDVRKRLDSQDVDSIDLLAVDGKMRQQYIINESGLYTLILGSRKPQAKSFQRWVTGDVLPSIRKTGSYALVASKDAQIIHMMQLMIEMQRDMAETRKSVTRMVEIMERNEAKIATHDLIVASELELSMTELSAVLGFRDVRKFTETLRESRVLIKKQYTVTYDGKMYQRHRNTPTAKWRHLINVRSQFSGENVVTVPYARPQATAALHMELGRLGYDLPPLPTVEEQRVIVLEIRSRAAIESGLDD